MFCFLSFVTIDSTSKEYRHDNSKQPGVQFEDDSNNNTNNANGTNRNKKNSDSFVFRELSVPRRPKWDHDTTATELDESEKESFLEWRRAIALREEEVLQHEGGSNQIGDSRSNNNSNNISVTPFEKNLEVWRQLWRVLERSSCVVQIVDGRNPLFYLSQDLRRYATEELGKPMLLIINKSDYLSAAQRRAWHVYLKKNGWDHLFFSAYDEQQKLDEAAAVERKLDREEDEFHRDNPNLDIVESDDVQPEEEHDQPTTPLTLPITNNVGVEAPLTREELMDWLHDFATRFNCERDARYDNRMQFGMVGFPNVGKSSVINVLVGSSKHAHGVVRVGVAAQPGKTKHFQTLFLPDRDDMMLCDCPGLVFPSFVSSTADLIAAGVYPIAQMRDHWPVVGLICRRIPREILNAHYGFQLPKPSMQDLRERGILVENGIVGDDDETTTVAAAMTVLPPPTAEDLLETYCIARSVLAASSGIPDYQRASRVIIKDYADGKLLYCHSPPDVEELMSSDNDVLNGNVPMNDLTFHRETLLTSLRRTDKLRQKISPLLELAEGIGHHTRGGVEEDDDEGDVLDSNDNNNHNEDDLDYNIDDDLDILDVVGGFAETALGEDAIVGGNRGKAHKSKQKHGKKGRKDRNKDPYGCHSTPDEGLVGGDKESSRSGLIVNAGKYGGGGYTRPNYSGARSATTTAPSKE